MTSMLAVKATAPGVWLVHQFHQPAVEGVAVYRYAGGTWDCEKCGSTLPPCTHITRIQQSGGYTR